MDQIKDQNAKENTLHTQQATNSSENSSTSSSSSSIVINDNDQLATDTQNDSSQTKEKRNEVVDQAARPSTMSAATQLQSPRLSAFSETSRLPASIFTRPGTPGDWSMASNESLFSIHVGNFMFRSGELTKFDQDLIDTAAFARASEALDDAYFFNEIRAGEGHQPMTRTHVSRHSFQFPVLPEGSDGGWISSPKMLEPRRQRTAENILQAPQSQPIMHIMRRRKQPPRFETKPKNYSRVLSRLFSFSSCCAPCRRHAS